jgi:hypothetical protein
MPVDRGSSGVDTTYEPSITAGELKRDLVTARRTFRVKAGDFGSAFVGGLPDHQGAPDVGAEPPLRMPDTDEVLCGVCRLRE